MVLPWAILNVLVEWGFKVHPGFVIPAFSHNFGDGDGRKITRLIGNHLLTSDACLIDSASLYWILK